MTLHGRKKVAGFTILPYVLFLISIKKKTAQNLFPAQERPSARLTADHCLGWYCRKALTQGDDGKACESAKEIFCILRRLFCIR